MKLGIASWSVPWSIGVKGYPQPEHWPPFAGTIEQTIRIEEEWLARSVRFMHSKLSAIAAAMN